MKHAIIGLNKMRFLESGRLHGKRGVVLLMTVVGLQSLLPVLAGTNPYLMETFEENGNTIDKIVVPGRPPTIKMQAAAVPAINLSAGINVLSNVPAFTWCYGCSATSAGMMMGYYDNIGYTNMYSGPSNGGVCPLNNETYWGSTEWTSVTCGECPLVATHKGFDGRTTRGHVDDYWIDYSESVVTDPYITDRVAEHTQGDCTGDYMGTNQSKYDNSDGSTTFYLNEDGSPLSNYTGCEPSGRDGCHGMRLFVESRGYTVTNNYSQYIYGYSGNTKGFTFTQYMNEINAGRPVMIQLEGHSMVGFGYNTSGNIIYIHDTWDHSDHTMTWGGTYSGMKHYGVMVVQMKAVTSNSPSAPTSLNASDGTYTDKVLLSWTPSSGATSYKIYRSASNSSASAMQLDASTMVSYSDTSAVANVTYYYWVKASNAYGDSAFSTGDSGRRAVAVTVSFDAQGGTVSPSSQTYAVGSTYGSLPTPTRSTYTFGGWWTAVGGTGVQIVGSSVVSASYTTLYAKWTQSCTVSFDAQDGTTPKPTSKSVVYGSAYGTLATTTRVGHTFAGWWTGAGGTGAQVTESTLVTATANHTLYAKWTTNAYAVTFDAQGGDSPDPASEMVMFGSPYGTLAVTVRTGYTFGGWFTNALCSGSAVTETTTVALASDHTLYAKWTANQYTVTFDAQGGTVTWQTAVVTFGLSYGRFPDIVGPDAIRVGYVFGGWFTGTSGTGEAVSSNTVMSVASNHTLYAEWTREPYLLSDAGSDSAFETVGSYNGYFYETNTVETNIASSVRGLFSLTVSTEAGKLTAKAIVQTGTLSFSASVWAQTNETRYAKLTAVKSGETLDLYVRQNRIWGTLSGGKLDEALTLDGTRNRFANSKDTEAQTLLSDYKGYYTIALPQAAALSLGSAEAAPQGIGYLAVTVGTGGSAKIAGVLSDGTSVSLSSRLLYFDSCTNWVCVPFFVPLYKRTGWIGGLLWIDPENRTMITDRDLGWYLQWVKPGSGADGFIELLDVCGGYYNTTPSLAAQYLFGAEMESVPYYYTGGNVNWVTNALPDSIAVTGVGSNMKIAAGSRPVKTNGTYTYAGENPSLATIAFTRRTGIFRGRFFVYYDYGLNSVSIHKTATVSYAGILTPTRENVFATLPVGLGYCLVPDNDPDVKTYKIKRSFPVKLEAE